MEPIWMLIDIALFSIIFIGNFIQARAGRELNQKVTLSLCSSDVKLITAY